MPYAFDLVVPPGKKPERQKPAPPAQKGEKKEKKDKKAPEGEEKLPAERR